MFIEKINFKANVEQMLIDLNSVLSNVPWPEQKIVEGNRVYHANQLGLTYRTGATHPWYDATGSLYDSNLKHFTGTESDFNQWNDIGNYTKDTILELGDAIGMKFGRIRYMRLLPKTGLSVHADFEPRYHFALSTNQYAYFGLSEPDGETDAKCYHIPQDGFFYKVNTLRNHFVFNGGWEPRIHLVMCEAK
jgi:hypothetical protein